MHNESNADRTVEQPKSSRLTRIKDATITAGIIVIPVGLTVVSFVYGVKMTKMQHDTAKLNLETAKLNKL